MNLPSLLDTFDFTEEEWILWPHTILEAKQFVPDIESLKGTGLISALQKASNISGSKVFSDLPIGFEKLLTKEQWTSISLKFHKFNKSSEDELEGSFPLFQYCLFFYFASRLMEMEN